MAGAAANYSLGKQLVSRAASDHQACHNLPPLPLPLPAILKTKLPPPRAGVTVSVTSTDFSSMLQAMLMVRAPLHHASKQASLHCRTWRLADVDGPAAAISAGGGANPASRPWAPLPHNATMSGDLIQQLQNLQRGFSVLCTSQAAAGALFYEAQAFESAYSRYEPLLEPAEVTR